MKKIITSLCLLTLFCSLYTFTAFAENTTGGATTISTEVNPAYTITIPEKLEILYNSTDAKALTLNASDLLLEAGKSVVVTAAGSGEDDAFTMANGNKTLAYELSKDSSPWVAVGKNGEVTSFSENGSKTIYVKVPDWSSAAAGKYSGTITFTVSYQ